MDIKQGIDIDRCLSDSPACTTDSFGSTIDSVETIVNRTDRITQTTLDNNEPHNENFNNTIRDDQTDKVEKDNKIGSDAQSHIYSSPVYMTTTEKPKQITDQVNPPKFISQAEFENLLQVPLSIEEPTDKSTSPFDLKISKKQRLPAELIKIKNISTEECTIDERNVLPKQVIMGVLQLLLSIALATLGALLLVRGASMASLGSGIWSAGIAAITGALGVINMRKVQTGFLALSLVCIATSTLALAISGVGLTRDINKLEEKLEPTKTIYERITAAYWMIFVLGLHFILSVMSVYKSSQKLCSRSQNIDSLKDNLNAYNIPMDKDLVDEYIKALSQPPTSNKQVKKDRLSSSQILYPPVRTLPLQDVTLPRPIILIPTSLRNTLVTPVQPTLAPMMRTPMYRVPPPYPMLFPQCVAMPPPPHMFRGGPTIPSKRGGQYTYDTAPIYQTRRQSYMLDDPQSQRKIRTNSTGRHQRRKSDTDADNQKAFTHIAMDNQVAVDNHPPRQDPPNGSNIDSTTPGDVSRNDNTDVVPI